MPEGEREGGREIGREKQRMECTSKQGLSVYLLVKSQTNKK